MSTGNGTAPARTCSICKKDFPATAENFYPSQCHRSRNNPLGLTRQCRPCHAAYRKKWHADNPHKAKAYRQATKANDPARHKERVTRKNRRTKAKALLAYSPDGPKCACCGETAFEFLTIDHIHGGGNKHRRQIGTHIYNHLAKEGFPPGYRVLCMNCNWAMGKFGYCPHKSPGLDIRTLWPATKKAGPGPASKVPESFHLLTAVAESGTPG